MLEKILTALFLSKSIVKNGEVYLRRWFLGYGPLVVNGVTVEYDGVSKLTQKWYHRFLVWFFLKNPKLEDLYLHKMLKSDDDKDPHDHPWDFDTTILWNGYDDESYRAYKCIKVSYNKDGLIDKEITGKFRNGPYVDSLTFLNRRKRSAEWCHQVKKHNDKPTWTLVRRGPYRREWNFMDEKGNLIMWREYLNERTVGNSYDPKV